MSRKTTSRQILNFLCFILYHLQWVKQIHDFLRKLYQNKESNRVHNKCLLTKWVEQKCRLFWNLTGASIGGEVAKGWRILVGKCSFVLEKPNESETK